MLDKAIVLDSPVEFVIVGPSGSRDKVLVRSKNAGLDLVGLAAHGEAGTQDIISSLWRSRPLNVVTSYPVPDIRSSMDSRHSKFRFAWRGLASASGIERVENVLNSLLPELHRAIEERDLEEIEWTISPVIYNCTRASEQRLGYRRVFLTAAALYLFIGVVAVIAGLFVQLVKVHPN